MCEIWPQDRIKSEDDKNGRVDRRNVFCFPQINVISKFPSKPNAFPYDIQEPHLILKSRVYPREVVHINMAINNIIHNIDPEATDLQYENSNLTLFRHKLFEENNEWRLTRKKVRFKVRIKFISI